MKSKNKHALRLIVTLLCHSVPFLNSSITNISTTNNNTLTLKKEIFNIILSGNIRILNSPFNNKTLQNKSPACDKVFYNKNHNYFSK